YELGLEVALETLAEQRRPLDTVGGEAVAETALTGTRDPGLKSQIAGDVVDALDRIGATTPSDESLDVGRVHTATRVGARSDTRLVRGAVLSSSPVADDMPRSLPDTRVALLTETVELPSVGTVSSRTEADATLDIDSFEERHAVAESERELFASRLDELLDSGCRVIITGMAVNDRVVRRLANRGVLAVHRVDDEELSRLARVAGGQVVPGLSELSDDRLGRADVSVERLAGEDHLFVRSAGTDDPVYTLLCRVADPRSIDELEASVQAAIEAVAAAKRDDGVVPGGGAAEVAAYRAVQRRTRAVEDRRQLAARGFADAVLTVPRALATNAGMDGWGTVVSLVAGHEAGRDAAVDAVGGDTADAFEAGPLADAWSIKRAALRTAVAAATQFVRIDDRISVSGSLESGTDESDEPAEGDEPQPE
ncbi:MAG: TCP-1/cpn60 chaperonin family protein, partial [Haloferacaceae archaeon]